MFFQVRGHRNGQISGLLNTSYKVEDEQMFLLLRFLFSSITYEFVHFESNQGIFL